MKKENMRYLIVALFCIIWAFGIGYIIGSSEGYRKAHSPLEKYLTYQRCIERIKNWDGKSTIEVDVEGVTITGSRFADIDSNDVVKIVGFKPGRGIQ